MLRLYICSKKKGKTSDDTDGEISFSPDEANVDLEETLPMYPLTLKAGSTSTAIDPVIDLTTLESEPQAGEKQETEPDHEQPSTSNAPTSRTENVANEEHSDVELLPQGVQTQGEDGHSWVRVHRCRDVTELVCIFKAPDMMAAPLKFQFVDELGKDAAGVSRDVFTTFWKLFFETYADGEEFRVPGLCPELGQEEWKAIGRIFVKGFVDHKILPLRMAPAFIIGILFGEEAVYCLTL